MQKILLAGLLLLPLLTEAQNFRFSNQIEGYWTGAFIQGNSVQNIQVDIFRSGDSIVSATWIPDWMGYSPERKRLVKKGTHITLQTQYGPIDLIWDSLYMEMTGKAENGIPPLNVHLKKSLKPAVPEVESRILEFSVANTTLEGTLFLPSGAELLPCAIIVHGRGCGKQNYDLEKARLMATHGLAVLVFDKRGSRENHPPCNSTTLEDHLSDLSVIYRELQAQPEIDPLKIGLIGYSAGGWVATAFSAKISPQPAFLVTVVGPSTDIRRQQLDGARYYGKNQGTTPKGIEQVERYTHLMFSENPKEAFPEMMRLLAESESENWRSWLEDTDIPSSPEDLQNLWVNRFDNYNPATDLGNFKGPFLSLLGESDNIVPWHEQVAVFDSVFTKAGKTNYEIVVIPQAWHNLEHGSQLRQLPWNNELRTRAWYYKFDRVAYGAAEEILLFLRKHNFLP